uniref:Methyltransferase-like protein 5 n=1 Tax=Culicoides sonorensis TaxID=179676 RepID=A0A336KU10_CULSO
MARLKLRKLEEYLQGLDDFETPKVQLEQYATPAHIASHMLYTIEANYQDIEGKLVADLGSGCGMLSVGAFLLGAAHVTGFEIDGDAIEIFKTNVDEMEIENIDVVQCDVVNQLETVYSDLKFDTVILNPPFGTKNNAGMDMKFLQSAISLTNGTIYSLHKTSTREYIKKRALDWNLTSNVIAELKYDLPSSYKFHKKQSVDIEVDFWRFEIAK